MYDKLEKCFKCLREKTKFKPEIALVLGSGLGDFAENIKIEEVIPYNEIEGFPVSTVAGHKGRFVLGYINDIPVVIMQGRVHFYEGYDMGEVVLPIRLMKKMGAEILLLTNAAGGVNESYNPGDLMIIKDHISSFIPSPLIGENMDQLGKRFPDMSEVYDKDLRDAIKKVANKLDIRVQEGVYVQFTGPAYETPTEVCMTRILGGDAVGMSTVCEAITANHMDMKICGISCITNMASGILEKPLDHKEVQETADNVSEIFTKLLRESVIEIYNLSK